MKYIKREPPQRKQQCRFFFFKWVKINFGGNKLSIKKTDNNKRSLIKTVHMAGWLYWDMDNNNFFFFFYSRYLDKPD